MKKILFLLILLLIPINVYALELPDTYSQKILVYDMTDDKILLSKKSDEVSKVASLTKIMTAIVAIENINNLQEEIVITQEMLNGIPWDAAVLKLEVGERVTVEDMLYAALLPSAADATHILAHRVSGSTTEFVKLMNKKAKELGLTHTSYENVIGMDHESHYSTAEDVAKLLKYCLKNKEFKKIFTGKNHTLLSGKIANSTIHIMQNVIQRDTSRILGGKTGYTDEAGTCIAVYFKSNGHEMLVITLKAPKKAYQAYHIEDALDMIDFTDKNFGDQIILEKGTPITTIDVKLSDITKYNVVSTKDISLFLPNDYDKDLISYEYEGATEILFNYKKGEELGKISYYYDGELVSNEFVVLEDKLSPNITEILDIYKAPIIGIVACSLFGIFVVIVLLKKSLA